MVNADYSENSELGKNRSSTQGREVLSTCNKPLIVVENPYQVHFPTLRTFLTSISGQQAGNSPLLHLDYLGRSTKHPSLLPTLSLTLVNLGEKPTSTSGGLGMMTEGT